MLYGLALGTLGITLSHAQTQTPTVRTTSAGVIIDVTVLDKDGRPVIDLKPEDFEVTEDGKSQKLLSATLMQGGVPKRLDVGSTSTTTASLQDPGAGPAAMPPGPVAVTPTVTAILFNNLTGDTRKLACRAAAAFVSTLASANEYGGVFVAGLGLTTVQRFTNQTPALRAAIDRIETTAPNNMSLDAERQARSSRTQGLDPSEPTTAGAEYGQGYTTVAEREKRLNQAGAEGKLVEMELRMAEGYNRFLAEYEGEAALSGLRAAIAGLSVAPGRKSILYFVEELPVTARLKSRFDALIGEANRANITIYPVDASGLRIHSKEAEVGRNVGLSGAQGVGDARRPDGPYTKDLEKQEEMLSSRPATVLGRLAGETGGFLIDNTNDLSKGVARMQIERNTYYLLGYQPINAAQDGKFRKVSVKVKRDKYTTVRARSGYTAASR
jgi:VWFA-related protein